MQRRSFTLAGLATALAAVSGGSASATLEPYPSKPVRVVVGFVPGGGTDIVARLLAQKLTEALGQAFVVDNRSGATGTIGAKVVATSAADGYTLLMGHVNSQSIAPALMERPPYDPIKEFAPVAYVGFVPNVLVVNPAMPAKTVAELVARSKSQPQGLTFASAGVGSTNQLAGEMLRLESGAKLVHVPYRGSGAATVDLLGNQVDMNFDVIASVMPYIKAGRLRALAVTGEKRDPEMPDVPTMAELGYKTFDIKNWYGVVAPAGTPPAIVEALHAAVQRALQQPDVVAKLKDLGIQREDMSSEQFGRFMRAELAKYKDMGKRTGVRLEQ